MSRSPASMSFIIKPPNLFNAQGQAGDKAILTVSSLELNQQECIQLRQFCYGCI